jgi:hypothetical protein
MKSAHDHKKRAALFYLLLSAHLNSPHGSDSNLNDLIVFTNARKLYVQSGFLSPR